MSALQPGAPHSVSPQPTTLTEFLLHFPKYTVYSSNISKGFFFFFPSKKKIQNSSKQPSVFSFKCESAAWP